MKEFKVLPTDPRYQDLTQDQIGFILTQMLLDKEAQSEASTKKPPVSDVEYEGSDPDTEQESYADNEFDEAWNSDGLDPDNGEWEEV